MHWCVYPSDSHRLFQAQHNLQPRVVKTVGVTGKISKWPLEKQPSKVLSSFHLQRKCFTDTEAYR